MKEQIPEFYRQGTKKKKKKTDCFCCTKRGHLSFKFQQHLRLTSLRTLKNFFLTREKLLTFSKAFPLHLLSADFKKK